MIRTRVSATIFIILGLAALGAYAQSFPPQGNDSTSSMGSFKIQVMPQFVSLFYHPNPAPAPPNICFGFDPSTNILSSPSPMLDPGTLIGRSMPILDGSNATPAYPAGPPSDLGGAPVGIPQGVISPSTVSESMLIPPPGFPCGGVSPCSSGSGTPEVHTEVESLFLTGTYSTGGVANVRAGQWYNSSAQASWPPAKISPGEVESQAGPNATPQTFFPASSFFDVFVQVDMPGCTAFPKAFPGGILYNLMPLVVKNNQVTTFPPQVVYLHDATSIVPILFLYDNPGFWHKDDILGYFLLVGHGVGMVQNDFDNFMGGQSNAVCPIGSVPPPGGTSVKLKSSAARASQRKSAKKTAKSNTKPLPGAGSGSTSGSIGAGGGGGGGGNR